MGDRPNADPDEVQRLFEEVSELPANQHLAFLERVGAKTPELRTELEKLLDAYHPSRSAQTVPSPPPREDAATAASPAPAPAAATPDTAKGETIGPYRVLGILGEGGMGTVYVAEQREPVERRVALKVIKLGMDSKQVLARFDAERQALARMDHPNIAKVFDAGTTERGQPYFAMELVKGVPITDFCDRHRFSIDERIELFGQVCEGLQHAHQKGVIHRDIKPSNVFAAMQREGSIVKIIDFGLARATDHRLGEHTVYTEHGAMIGTPEYMSPEQAEMSGLDIDTRTDVYSLGVLLYELLVGDLPFDRMALRRANPLEMQRRIIEDAPTKPSTRLQASGARVPEIAERRSTASKTLLQHLRGDLDWIVMRAIDKDRRRRYQTPMELMADLSRYQIDEPIQAGPPTVSYLMNKFVRRYRRQVAGVAAVFAVLIGALLFMWSSKRETDKALADFHRLADGVKLETFETRAGDLWPEMPEKVSAMETWLLEVDGWRASMLDHGEALAALRRRGTVSADAKPVAWLFEDPREQLLHNALAELVTELDTFFAEQTGVRASVEKRLAEAKAVREKTVVAHREAWDSTIEAIKKHPEYDTLQLNAQVGLVPVDQDPASGLFEFWMPRTGERPQRDPATGRLRVAEKTGLVFVLIPGGRFTMGSQDEDPKAENYFANAPLNEKHAHAVRLQPFFLSKYEMTQAQWVRLTGENPSRYFPGAYAATTLTPTNPVEQVSFAVASRVMGQYTLELPTEAQWEYACRAGTTTAWSTGHQRGSLANPVRINVADGGTGRPARATWPATSFWPELDDGFFWHAPVGTYLPNGFGLHNMHGNVMEWTRDHPAKYGSKHGEGDGAWTTPPDEEVRVVRGGAFSLRAESARSAHRRSTGTNATFDNVGVRPARRIVH